MVEQCDAFCMWQSTEDEREIAIHANEAHWNLNWKCGSCTALPLLHYLYGPILDGVARVSSVDCSLNTTTSAWSDFWRVSIHKRTSSLAKWWKKSTGHNCKSAQSRLSSKTGWWCKTETSEGGHRETCGNSEGVSSFRGSDWRDCAHNNSWLDASPVAALWQFAIQHVWDSDVSWKKLQRSDETKMELFGH